MKKVFALLSCLALAGGAALCAVACDIGVATDNPIITSITVRASDLTRGLGCGTRDGQVFKYTAVVHGPPYLVTLVEPDGKVIIGPDGTPVRVSTTVYGARVADCFADATFIDPIVANTEYTIDVSLFDKASFDANPPGALTQLPVGTSAPGAFGKLDCAVTALDQVQAFASCGEASALAVPARPDASSGDASGDAASDANADAGTDASDAAGSDANDATVD